MTRGKVVLVPFPFDDLATQKARPAVCLTEPVTSHRHIVLAFVTSRQPDEPLDTDVVLDPQDSGLRPDGSAGSVDD
jgi:mRNA interferase MazF